MPLDNLALIMGLRDSRLGPWRWLVQDEQHCSIYKYQNLLHYVFALFLIFCAAV